MVKPKYLFFALFIFLHLLNFVCAMEKKPILFHENYQKITPDSFYKRTTSRLWDGLVKYCCGTNFHKVTENLYRSGALTPEELAQIIDEHKIKEICSLTKKDYNQKEKIAKEKGISLRFVPLAGDKIPALEEILNLIKILQKIDHPVLFCGRGCGANAPAVVMAIYYLYVAPKLSKEERLQLALEQFSYAKYGYCVLYHEWLSNGGINFIKKLETHCPNLEDLPTRYTLIAEKTS